jgi:hypothetical protein
LTAKFNSTQATAKYTKSGMNNIKIANLEDLPKQTHNFISSRKLIQAACSINMQPKIQDTIRTEELFALS